MAEIGEWSIHHSSVALEHLRSPGKCCRLPEAPTSLALPPAPQWGLGSSRVERQQTKRLGCYDTWIAPGQAKLQKEIHKCTLTGTRLGDVVFWSGPQNHFVVTQMVIGCLLTYKEPDGSGGDSLLIGISWFGMNVGTSLPGSRSNIRPFRKAKLSYSEVMALPIPTCLLHYVFRDLLTIPNGVELVLP